MQYIEVHNSEDGQAVLVAISYIAVVGKDESNAVIDLNNGTRIRTEESYIAIRNRIDKAVASTMSTLMETVTNNFTGAAA